MSMDQAIESLKAEAASLRAQLQAVEKAIVDLGGTLGRGSFKVIRGGAGKPKGQMSPEGRARIAAAQKKRWAAKRAADAKKSRTRKAASAARKAKPRGKRAKAVRKKVAAKAAATKG